MTDNRTNEYLIVEARSDAALRRSHFEDKRDIHPYREGKVNQSHAIMDRLADALEAADHLAKQKQNGILPNFACTDEQVEVAAKAIADCHNPGMFEKYPENWRVEARAALVAAAGAAPQTECEHFHIWSELPCKPAQCRMEPAQVQPSSTVDEDALAEVIDKALIRHGEMAGMSNQERWDARDDIARAVAEWLKEQGGESCGE